MRTRIEDHNFRRTSTLVEEIQQIKVVEERKVSYS